MGSAYSAISQNRYTYTGNSPVMFEDPSGHFSITKWVTDKVSDVANKVSETYTAVKEKVVDVYNDVKDFVEEKVEQAKEFAKDVECKATIAAEVAKYKVSSAVNTATTWVKDHKEQILLGAAAVGAVAFVAATGGAGAVCLPGLLAAAGGGAALGAGGDIVGQMISNGSMDLTKIDWGSVAMSGLSGAVTSVAMASGMGRVGTTIVGAVTGGVSELYNQVKSGGSINWGQVAIRTAGGAVSGFIMGNASSGSKAAEEVAKKTAKQIAKESVGVFAQTTATTFVEDYAYNRAGGYSRSDSAKSALFTSVISGFTDASLYSLGEVASNMCFVAGTMVLTAEGLVAIESIAVGDKVIATDPDTGETTEKQVLNTFVNETDELAHVWVDGEEIICTPGHKFYAPEKGWTSAIDLKAGDILVLSNGEYVNVEKVQHELLEEPVKVYNFEVEDFHTYYVGTDVQVLVHNMGCGGNKDPQVQEFAEKFEERYPGRDYKSGHTVIHSDGRELEVDFETDNSIIEFKEGKGKGLTRQVKDRMDSSANPQNKVVIGVSGKKSSPHVKRDIEAVGGLMSDDIQIVLDIIKPDK